MALGDVDKLKDGWCAKCGTRIPGVFTKSEAGKRREWAIPCLSPGRLPYCYCLSWSKMKSHTVRLSIIFWLLVLLVATPAFSQVTVIFARHAEKAAAPPKDPPLTDAGHKRAELLASMLADSGVTAIYVTDLQRTQQTAAPLAARVHIKPTAIPASNTAGLIKAIHELKSGVVVAIGHSNTLPAIIAGLGGPTVTISDSDYDNLFVLTVGPTQSSLLRMHYGSSVPVPPAGEKTQPMTPGSPVK